MRYRYLLMIWLSFFSSISFADWNYCSLQKFCLTLPDTMMVINQKNYKNYINELPKSIYKKFTLGSKREIITDKFSNVEQSNRSSFFVIESSTPSINDVSIEGTCNDLKKIEGDSLKICEPLFKGSIKQGMWALTYGNNNGLSFTRIWIDLNKKHHVFAVSAGKFHNETDFRILSAGMLKILKTVKNK